DGLIGLCTDDSSSGVRFFRNDGTSNFVLQSPRMLDADGNPLNASFASTPAFVDIDGDSLTDFLSNNTLDGSINFYKNIGTRTDPLFKLITSSFQNIIVIGDTCYSPGMRSPLQHGSGFLRFVDIDANGKKDLFYGDLFCHDICFMMD